MIFKWIKYPMFECIYFHFSRTAIKGERKWSHSVVSNSLWPHGLQPSRLLCPWDSPGKSTGVGCHFLLQCMKVKSESEVAQSCLTLRDPVDCSLPGSPIHGILQAGVLEWGATAFSVAFLRCQLMIVANEIHKWDYCFSQCFSPIMAHW